jgi:sugar phosphate isomerase/epimerase
MSEDTLVRVYEGSGAHLKRVIDLYKELGIEVKIGLLPFGKDMSSLEKIKEEYEKELGVKVEIEPSVHSECETCRMCYEISREPLCRVYVKRRM